MTELDQFVPAQGRTVVYGFRNAAAWTTRPGEPGLVAVEGHEPFIYRPAQIVRVWTKEGPKTANLVVFLDGSNDRSYIGAADGSLMVWKTSAVIGDEDALANGREHYLPRVPDDYSGA
jgi:hypothetical protein